MYVCVHVHACVHACVCIQGSPQKIRGRGGGGGGMRPQPANVGGSWGMPPRKILNSRCSEIVSGGFFPFFFFFFLVVGRGRSAPFPPSRENFVCIYLQLTWNLLAALHV